MCGRFTLTAEQRVVAERFGVLYPRGFAGTGTGTGKLSVVGDQPSAKAKKPIGDSREPKAGFVPRYNIAPTQSVIVVGDDGERYLKQMRWGLIPSWAKDESIGNRMINARAETIAEKPAFRAALKKRRCLIPADGFYEWKKGETPKAPHRKSTRL